VLPKQVVGAVTDGVHWNDSGLDPTKADGIGITVPFAAGRVHAGLQYYCDLKTLQPDPPGRGGTTQSQDKITSEVILRVLNSRGGFMGTGPADLHEIKQRRAEEWYEAIELLTGEMYHNLGSGWNRGQVFFRQSDPLPVEIMSMIYSLESGSL
jgi:hypothetical protein